MKIVGEVALSHDGSLGQAYSYIDAVAASGADAIKFQVHSPQDRCQQFREGIFFPQDETRADYWRRTAFSRTQWEGLANHARAKGLAFGASVFALDSVQMMAGLVDYFKIGAGEIDNQPLIEEAARTKKPLVLSSGMSDWNELDYAVKVAWRLVDDLTILQCTSQYPCPPERIGLNVMEHILERYCVPFWGRYWGLSDHSGKQWPGLVAAWLGADMLEVHVSMSRQQFGPDTEASLTFAEFKDLVDGCRWLERARANAVDKVRLADELSDVRKVFRGIACTT